MHYFIRYNEQTNLSYHSSVSLTLNQKAKWKQGILFNSSPLLNLYAPRISKSHLRLENLITLS